MDSRHARAPHPQPRRCALAALALLTSGPLASRPSLQAVRLVAGDGVTSVVLSADGALPSPKVGVLTDPPRIYLDFPDVAAATEGTLGDGDLLVRAVRVAVTQSRPLVTRVVIDLAGPAPHRIEAGQRASGQLTVVVGVPVAPARAPTPRPPGQGVAGSAPSLPRPSPVEPPRAAAPAAAPAPVPAVPASSPAGLRPQAGEPAARAARSPEFSRAAGATASRAPAKDVAQYLQRASPLLVLERLERLRPLLVALDALGALPEEELRAATGEFGAIRRALAAIEPPRTLAATHELLRDVCVLGAAAAAARVAPAAPDDSTRAWNAAAAAAGALMLLDRARAELGLAPGRT
jgi:hypothetical protein